MANIYINLHPGADYAMAVIRDYIDLRQYVREREYLLWDSPRRGAGVRQIMILRTDKGEQNITDFINDMKALQCEVYTRNNRGDEWDRG